MNIITKLSIRQKVMLTLTVLAAAFLTWQIYNFVHGNGAAVQPVNAPAPHIPAKTSSNTLPPPPVRPLPVRDTSKAILTPSQQAYLGLVHEYQVTKIRRQILEEQASLASAQKRISDANRSSSFSNYSSYNELMTGEDVQSAYQLAYLDRQAGQWTATLNRGGQYQEVRVGTRLADGASVVSITNKGVVLKFSHGKPRMISFQGSVNVDNTPVEESSSTNSANTNTNTHQDSDNQQTQQNIKPLIENITNNIKNANPANNAKIAKILGITAAPPSAPGAPTAPTPTQISPTQMQPQKSSRDIPAAPITQDSPAANLHPVLTPPVLAPATNTNPSMPPAPATPTTSAPLKPVSVKELQKSMGVNEANGPVTKNFNQISWQQEVNLQQAASEKTSSH